MNYNNGNMNNNNTYNRYFVVGASESVPNIDEWFVAERSFFKNKHKSCGAQRIHIHPAKVLRIARSVAYGTYEPKPGYRFPLFEPSPREIFASFCEDRLVHHYVAPFISEIAEVVHENNGNVSHGNRIAHSAQTGAEQIKRESMKATMENEEPYFVRIDIRSFFTSIPRENAYRCFEDYARQHYSKDDINEKLSICKILILHNPIDGCVRLSSESKWKKIPERKLMKNAGEGNGLPIGNFYSQLIANLYLSSLDAAIKGYGTHPRFVDDKCIVAKDKETAKACIQTAKLAVSELGLMLHPDKLYMQPIHRGVNFCGRTIKGGRIYLSSKTIKRAVNKVRMSQPSEKSAVNICNSVNSYIGLMKHCTEWKNERRLADMVLERYSEWLFFIIRKGHLVCEVREEFKKRNISKKIFDTINEKANETRKTNKRNNEPR